MRRQYARLAAVCACACAVATSVLCGVALAGGGHGNGNGWGSSDQGSASQQQPQPFVPQPTTQPMGEDEQSSSVEVHGSAKVRGNSTAHVRAQGSIHVSVQSSASAGAAAEAKAHGSAKHSESSSARGQVQSSTQASVQASSSAGVKPSSTTTHWTHCRTGGTTSSTTCASSDNGHTPQTGADVSKRYGNGKTAAQIAVSRGGVGVQLTGPGNSQPHKVSDCRHKSNRSGGVDVHAVKSYSLGACTTQSEVKSNAGTKTEIKTHGEAGSNAQAETGVGVAVEQGNKVTLCHATGSATNPYVQITVDAHALKNGHTTAKGDIIPAPATGCPTVAAATAPSVTFCANGVMMTASATVVIASYLSTGAIVPPFTYNGQTYSANWDVNGQAVLNNHCQANSQAQVQGNGNGNVNGNANGQANGNANGQANGNANGQVNGNANGQVQAPATTAAPATTPATAAAPATQSNNTGVLGTQTSAGTPKSNGGVLGTVTKVSGSTLPFTGFPLWLAVLVAFALILAGIALSRRRGEATHF